MSRWPTIPLFAALLTACDGLERLYVPMPPEDGSKTLVLGASIDGDVPARIRVIDLENGSDAAVEEKAPAGSEISLEAWTYALTPGELDLETDWVDNVDDGVPLDPFDFSYRYDPGLGWQSSPEIRLLDRFRLPGGRCTHFVPELIALDPVNRESLRGMVVLDGATVLISSRAGAFLLSLDGTARPLTRDRPEMLLGGVGGTADLLLGGDENGQVYRFDLDRDRNTLNIAETFTRTSSTQVQWIAGSNTDEGLEMFALDIEGHFDRYSAGDWETLDVLVMDRTSERSRLLHRGPHQAMVVSQHETAVVVFDHGKLTRERIAADELGYGLISLTETPEGIFGGGWGRILRRSSQGTWTSVPDVPPQTLITAVAGYEGNLVYGGRSIARELKLDGTGLCPEIGLADSGKDKWFIGELDGGVLVVGGARFDRETGVEMTKVAMLRPP